MQPIHAESNATYSVFENVPPITDLWEDEEDASPLLRYFTYTSRKVSVTGKEGNVYEMNALVQFLHQSMRHRATDKKKKK